MKLTLTKYGGLAAGIRRPPRVVDAAALPKAAAGELVKLVAAAKAVPAAEEDFPGRARDAMSYRITVEDNGPPTVFSQSDATMTPAFAALLSWLEKYAAAK